jgi:hypothetical protein
MKLLVNFSCRVPPGGKHNHVKIAGVRNIPPALHSILSRSAIEATAEIVDRLLLESLILAQDERWRRA